MYQLTVLMDSRPLDRTCVCEIDFIQIHSNFLMFDLLVRDYVRDYDFCHGYLLSD